MEVKKKNHKKKINTVLQIAKMGSCMTLFVQSNEFGSLTAFAILLNGQCDAANVN